MADDELTSLKNELSTLKKKMAGMQAEIDDIGKALMRETENNTQHYGAIYRYIADIHDYLMPILHKVFPHYQAAKKQIDAFMEQYGVPKNARKIP